MLSTTTGQAWAPKSHTAMETISRYPPQSSWDTLPWFNPAPSILVPTHFPGRRGQSHQAEVSAHPLSVEIHSKKHHHPTPEPSSTEGLLSSSRALEDLAPNQGWWSSLSSSSSQQVRAPLAKGKETSSHANTTFTPRPASVTTCQQLGQPLPRGGDTVTLQPREHSPSG